MNDSAQRSVFAQLFISVGSVGDVSGRDIHSAAQICEHGMFGYVVNEITHTSLVASGPVKDREENIFYFFK